MGAAEDLAYETEMLAILMAKAKTKRGLPLTPADEAALAIDSAPTPEPKGPFRRAPVMISTHDELRAKCQSAPEEKLFHALIHLGSGRAEGDHVVLTSSDGTRCLLVPQQPVMGGAYRIDFALFGEGQQLAIEIDGYAYHYATPELALRTLQRRRELQSMGWDVLTYAATEIMGNIAVCAMDILGRIRWVP